MPLFPPRWVAKSAIKVAEAATVRMAASLRLDTGAPDERAPALGFRRHMGAEGLRRSKRQHRPLPGKSLPDFGSVEGLFRLAVHPGDCRRRRVRGSEQAEPGACF